MNKTEMIGAGIIAGLAGVVAFMGFRDSDEHKIARTLDSRLDELSRKSELDIDETIVNEAVKRAVDREINERVKNISWRVEQSFKDGLSKKVAAEVSKSQDDIHKKVTDEVVRQVERLDIREIKKAAAEKGSEKYAEAMKDEIEKLNTKYEERLDDIFDKYEDQLGSVNDIYAHFARRFSGSSDSGKNKGFNISFN